MPITSENSEINVQDFNLTYQQRYLCGNNERNLSHLYNCDKPGYNVDQFVDATLDNLEEAFGVIPEETKANLREELKDIGEEALSIGARNEEKTHLNNHYKVEITELISRLGEVTSTANKNSLRSKSGRKEPLENKQPNKKVKERSKRL